MDTLELVSLEDKAAEAVRVLKLIANERRLLILCELSERGEVSVSDLSETVGIAQSALSQHLAKMREEGLVTYRRDAQTLYYRIAEPRVGQLLEMLRDVFC